MWWLIVCCVILLQGAQAAKKHHSWLIKKIKDKLVRCKGPLSASPSFSPDSRGKHAAYICTCTLQDIGTQVLHVLRCKERPCRTLLGGTQAVMWCRVWI